jgi:peptidyl-prolyl cis-trans isomerase D
MRAVQHIPMPLSSVSALLTDYTYEKRVVDVVHVPMPSPGAFTPPHDLEPFYRAHKDLFAVPESRDVTELWVDASAIVVPPVTDDAVHAYYDAHSASMQTPGFVTLETTLFPDRVQAETAIARVQAGAAFADAVPKAQRMDHIDPQTLPPALRDAVLTLRVGQLSAPVQTALGWHVMHVLSIEAGRTQSFPEAASGIRTTLENEAKRKAVRAMTDAIVDALAVQQPLESIAARYHLIAERLPALTQEMARHVPQEAPYGTSVALRAASAMVVDQAFGTDAKPHTQHTPATLALAPDHAHYIAVYVHGVLPGHIPPLDEVLSAVRAAWQRDAALAHAKEMASHFRTTLAAHTQAGDTLITSDALNAAARAAGYITNRLTLARPSAQPPLPGQHAPDMPLALPLMEATFRLPNGGVSEAMLDTHTTSEGVSSAEAVIVHVAEILRPHDPALLEATTERLRQRIDQETVDTITAALPHVIPVVRYAAHDASP